VNHTEVLVLLNTVLLLLLAITLAVISRVVYQHGIWIAKVMRAQAAQEEAKMLAQIYEQIARQHRAVKRGDMEGPMEESTE
jgi:hypothetical protein